MNPAPRSAADRPSPVIGATYLAALYAGDTDMLSALRMAFTAEELLDVLTEGFNSPVMILGRRAQQAEGFRTLTEFGDVLVKTAVLLQRKAEAEAGTTHQ